MRKHAKDVLKRDIGSPKLKKIIRDMKEALAGEKYGAALAAPQIGVPLRIFIVSGRVLPATGEEDDGSLEYPPDLVFINPTITRRSRDSEPMDEGCLSVRGLYGIVNRRKKVTIKAYDEEGKAVSRGASGLLAQIFQHETDHLDGILFTDKAEEVWKVREDFEDAHEAKKIASEKRKAYAARKGRK